MFEVHEKNFNKLMFWFVVTLFVVFLAFWVVLRTSWRIWLFLVNFHFSTQNLPLASITSWCDQFQLLVPWQCFLQFDQEYLKYVLKFDVNVILFIFVLHFNKVTLCLVSSSGCLGEKSYVTLSFRDGGTGKRVSRMFFFARNRGWQGTASYIYISSLEYNHMR